MAGDLFSLLQDPNFNAGSYFSGQAIGGTETGGYVPPSIPAPAQPGPTLPPAVPGPPPNNQPPVTPTQTGGAEPKSGMPSQTPVVPPPPKPPSNPNVRLPLDGNDMNTQAKMLTDWLRAQGVDVTKLRITVGGESPYDAQINALINRINDPNTQDAALHQIAQDLVGLINLRNQSVAPTQTYGSLINYQNGQIQAPGGRDINDLISQLYNPLNPTGGVQLQKNTVMTPENQDTLNALLKSLAGGGVDPAQKQLMESQFIDSAEHTALSKRQQMADNLAANGIQGGAAVDKLGQIDNEAAQTRVGGLRDIQNHIMDQQLQSKQSAMGALLQQQGMDAANAQLLARLVQDAQQGQVSAALSLQGNQLGERGQNLTYLMHLLDLASAGDEDAKHMALALLQSLGLNQDVQP